LTITPVLCFYLFSRCGFKVVHHGTDHRSQVCTALTSLGVEPPDIDVWAYAREFGRERLERAQD
jgi:hypothetical protein